MVKENHVINIKILPILRCPVCKTGSLKVEHSLIKCQNTGCQNVFPIIDGIPILLNEKNSLFSTTDFISHKATTFSFNHSFWMSLAKKIIPSMIDNFQVKKNMDRFIKLVLNKNEHPRALVIGGSILGEGMDKLVNTKDIELIETDVSFGERTALICDAHDLPFMDNSVDGIILQAVLEHVIDPNQCVSEAYRVLKEGGIIYSETPFIQQVHMGKYDFTRYTELGHRRLFRKFDEIDRGAVGGPGMALAWSYRYFLLSFFENKYFRNIIKVFANLTSFYLKYIDRYLIKKRGVFDAASGYYFMGKKVNKIIDDRIIIESYKGLV